MTEKTEDRLWWIIIIGIIIATIIGGVLMVTSIYNEKDNCRENLTDHPPELVRYVCD